MRQNNDYSSACNTISSKLKDWLSDDHLSFISNAQIENKWFDIPNIGHSLTHWADIFTQTKTHEWIEKNYRKLDTPKNVGIICAGNIPLVGFHDVLSVLVSGHNAIVKLSSQDSFLMKHVTELLVNVFPEWQNHLRIVDKITNVEAVIATGSNNTSRYFEYYFSKIPHLIRKNRTSVAILTGNETEQQLVELGKDVFYYYGLGCRSVTKLYVPSNYDFTILLTVWKQHFEYVINHTKYFNNYEYRKAIFLINNIEHLDNGIILLVKDTNLFSHVGTIHFEHYQSIDDCFNNLVDNQSENIQVISTEAVSASLTCRFGNTQKPHIDDYADGVNVMEFLHKLN